MANSYHLPADPSDVDWSDTSIALYTRNSLSAVRLQRSDSFQSDAVATVKNQTHQLARSSLLLFSSS